MLAPEPFFEPRGTPFSEYHRIKALGELGHHVDLVTYPIGRNVELPNLRIFRSLRPPFVRKVRIGPSFTKVVLDTLMVFTILRRALADRYDAIHSHEEMGLVGVWLAKWLGIPHLYDMHSSLPQQLSNFKYSQSSALRGFFHLGRRPDGAQIAGRDHDLPGAAGHRLGDGRGRAVAADRERDGRRRGRTAFAIGGGDPRRVGHCSRGAAGPLHRNVRSLSRRRHVDRRIGHRREAAP